MCIFLSTTFIHKRSIHSDQKKLHPVPGTVFLQANDELKNIMHKYSSAFTGKTEREGQRDRDRDRTFRERARLYRRIFLLLNLHFDSHVRILKTVNPRHVNMSQIIK